MANNNEIRAKNAFETFCAYFDGRGLKYDRNDGGDGNYSISISGKGKDLSMNFFIAISAKNELLSILSEMPFTFEQNKIVEGVIATTIVTDLLREGSFDFDIKSGRIFYRLTTSFNQMEVTKELCAHMFEISTYTVDRYNDKLFMVAKGAMSSEEFYNFVHSNE